MPVATAEDVSALLDRITKLEDSVRELAERADRQLACMGKGREPSPRLQAAFDRARLLVPTIRPQESPPTDPED